MDVPIAGLSFTYLPKDVAADLEPAPPASWTARRSRAARPSNIPGSCWV
jgi:hypothetical protein